MVPDKEEIVVMVEYSEGAAKRITDAFAELHYAIKKGIYQDPCLNRKQINKENQLKEK